MKKSYYYLKTIMLIVFLLLMQTSFAQEVDNQQQLNTDVTTVMEEGANNAALGQDDLLNSTARASGGGVPSSHWETFLPTSAESLLSPNKSYNSVDMSTGKVNVQVPITTVETSNIQVPIGLNYSTGGIKLKDVASWVGLGWNLSCGGKISRVLNKYPDTFGWAIDSLLKIESWTITNDLAHFKGNFDARLKNQKADTQPDLFYYEIPGKSGMFVLDNQGNAATIPYQNITINYNQTNKTFEIIDDVGTSYSFNDTETTHIKTVYVPETDLLDLTYESTWYLTEIRSVKGDVVDFEYKKLYSGNLTIQYGYNTVSRSWITTSERDGSFSQTKYTTTIDPLYLTKISWRNGRMEFISSKNRVDIPNEAFQLDQIKLYSAPTEGDLLKSYNFGYSAFTNKSLKLDNITLSTPKSTTPEFFRKLEYYTDVNRPEIVDVEPFHHYFEHDHWGYYNGQTGWNDDGVPIFRINDKPQIIHKESFDNRSASLPHCRANSLKRVWVTKSGYDEFEYELNTSKYKFDPYDFSDTIALVGGLRIKSITTKSTELNNVAQKVRYEYTDEDGTSSGIVFNKIDYHHTGGFWGPTKYFIISNSSVRSLFDLDGSHIRYGRIKEIFDNGSNNTYTFTTKLNRPDSGYCKAYYFTIDGKQTSYYTISHTNLTDIRIDFAPVNTRFWERGLLTEKVSKDATGKETHKETYEYNYNAPERKRVHCLFPFTGGTSKGDLNPGNPVVPVIIVDPYLVFYDYVSQPIYMNKKIVSGIDTPTITTEYIYDDKDGYSNDLDHVLLKKQIETSGADKFVTTYKYPFDYQSPGPQDGSFLQFMKDNNISSTPIEVVKYKGDNHVIGGELYLYDTWRYYYNGEITGRSYFNLREVKELMLKEPVLKADFTYSYISGSKIFYDSDYVTKANYEYNSNNQLGCVKERNKPSQLILYDKMNMLPIAQITNAEAKKISGSYCVEAFYTSFEDFDGSTHPRAKTGSKVLRGGYYTNMSSLVAGTYCVSYWQSFNDGVDWELYETEVEVMKNDNRQFTIGNPDAIIDEYRIWKKGSQMQTKSYDSSYNVTSETDANGQTTYYEYDAFGRLLSIKDNTRHNLKSYKYYLKK